MPRSNPLIRFFCIAMLLLALLAGVGAEWYLRRMETLYQSRRKEMIANALYLHLQVEDSIVARMEQTHEMAYIKIIPAWREKYLPLEGREADTLQSALLELDKARNGSLQYTPFCPEKVRAWPAGNACTSWKLALLYYSCGPLSQGLFLRKPFVTTSRETTVVPLIPSVVYYRSLSYLPDSLKFTIPKTTGGFEIVRLQDSLPPF